jgi:predicted RNase H-like nuclease (RuvC/YqgF family)
MKLINPRAARARKAATTKRRKKGATRAWATRRKSEIEKLRAQISTLKAELRERDAIIVRLTNDLMHR